MSTRDFLHFLFETSQVDAETESLLREAEDTERLTAKKTPLLKALKAMGIPTENVTVDEDGAKLTVLDSALYHEIVRKLGSVEAVNNLADEGWVPEFAGDVADTTELPEYVLNFLPLHDVEYSEQDKATPVDKLNKELQGGSDTVIPDEQKKRDSERRHGVKVGESEDVAKKHQKKIALDTLKMSDAGARVMGGMTKEEARNFLRKLGYSDARIAKLSEAKCDHNEMVATGNKTHAWKCAKCGHLYGKDEKLPPKTESEVDALLEALPREMPDDYPAPRGGSTGVSWGEEPNGDLKITINDPEDLAELKEKVAAGDTSDDLFINAISSGPSGGVLGNGLNLVRPEQVGALTSSLLFSDTFFPDENDAEYEVEVEGAKLWWYPNYQVRSPVEDLAEKGFVIFKNAGPVEKKASVEASPALAAVESATTKHVDALLEAPDSFVGTDQPETCRKCGARVKILSGGEVEGEPLRVRCEPCNYEYSVEADEEMDEYENPLDAQGQPIVVEFVAGADTGQISWAEFCEANADMDFAELADIRNTILRGETYRGGGGAAGEYTVRRVSGNPNLAPNTALDVQAGNNAAGLNTP